MLLVTGASGFVGEKILRTYKEAVACPSLIGASEELIKRIVEESGVDTIIHTAAIADMGVCERDPEASYYANVQIPVYLAKAARSKGIKLICFSSDQVYSGTDEEGPYTEDMAKAGNTYAGHKLEMEQRVLDIDPNAVMLRAEWMYDYYLKKSNYFMNMLRANEPMVFSNSSYRGVTYVKEVADNIERVMKLPGGAYNYGSETTKTMYEISKDLAIQLGKNIQILEATDAGHNLWMNCDKARKYGVEFLSVEDGLVECAKDYKMLK